MTPRRHRTLGMGIGALAGVLGSWLLFDWHSPSGFLIVFCMALGGLLFPSRNEQINRKRLPPLLRLRNTPPWNRIVRVSGFLFLLFLCLATLADSPKILPNEQLRSGFLLLCGGLALLSGSPLMAAIESRLNLLWILGISLGLMLTTVGILVVFSIDLPAGAKLGLIAGSMVLPLVVALTVLYGTERQNQQKHNKLDAGDGL